MERSALHRKLKSLGLHGGAMDDRNGGEAATETRGA
jgi:two-component system nitrogen regulation response regulator NtrX